jgi:hypothetical protein
VAAERPGVVGQVHFKELGDHLLELDGRQRKSLEIKDKLNGSGGVSCVSNSTDFVDIPLR